MKKKSGLCALLALCLLLGGCTLPEYMKLKGVNTDTIFRREAPAGEETSPTPAPSERPDGCEGAALDLLEAVRDGRRSQVRLFSEDVPGFAGESLHPLFAAAYGSLQWKLQGFKESGSGYLLTVELTARDMRTVLQRLSDAVEERQTPGCDRPALAEQVLEEILGETEYETVTRRVSMNLSRATGTWMLRGSDELYNALSGYLLQGLKEFDLSACPLSEESMEDGESSTKQNLYNGWQCGFSLLGIYPDAPGGYTLAVECVNKNDGERVFSARNILVNGFLLEASWHETVGAGQTRNGSITISRGELERCGIRSVKNIRFLLEEFTAHAWPVYPELSVGCTVYPHGRDDSVSPLPEREGEKRLMDSWCAGVTVLEIRDEGCWGCTLLLAAENRSGEELWFGVGELSADGLDFDPGWSVTLPAGARAVKELRIPAGVLLSCGSDGVKTLDFRVFVSDLVNLDKKDEGIREKGRYTLRLQE